MRNINQLFDGSQRALSPDGRGYLPSAGRGGLPISEQISVTPPDYSRRRPRRRISPLPARFPDRRRRCRAAGGTAQTRSSPGSPRLIQQPSPQAGQRFHRALAFEVTPDAPPQGLGRSDQLDAGRRLHPAEAQRAVGMLNLHPVEDQHPEAWGATEDRRQGAYRQLFQGAFSGIDPKALRDCAHASCMLGDAKSRQMIEQPPGR